MVIGVFGIVWFSVGTVVFLLASACLVIGLQGIDDIWHSRRDVGRRLLLGGIILFAVSLLLLSCSPTVHDFLK